MAVLLVLLLATIFLIVPPLVAWYVLIERGIIRNEPLQRGAYLVNLYGLLMLLLVGVLFAVIDGEFASSLNLGCLLLFVPYGVLFGLLLAHRRPHWLRIGAVAAVFLFSLAIRPIDWGVYKPFLRRLDRIQTGMTPAQVEAIMAGYEATPTTLAPSRAYEARVCSLPYMTAANSETARYFAPQPRLNCAIVKFREGRVTAVEYDNE